MILPTLARLIVREHLYKPIQGKVLCLGRQKIAMSYEQVIELLKQEDFTPPDWALERTAIPYDEQTRGSKGTTFITDMTFFSLLGIIELYAVDVTECEGATIVHDLNKPVPESLYGQFDFIIDGGTFDHVFDIRVAFENVVKLLNTHGRVIHWNAASNFTGAAYLSFGPDLFFDYYVLNQFADCKVYLVEVDDGDQGEGWDFYEFEGTGRYDYFRSDLVQMTVVLAEKGSFSTWHKIPVQAQYREEHLWEPFRTAQAVISLSGRKSWVGSRSGHKLSNWKYQKPKSSVDLLAKIKEKGFVWCFKKLVSKASKRLEKRRKLFTSFLNRKMHRPRGKELAGYRYVGKI